MTERRNAKRFELFLPLQVCVPRRNRAEFHSAHLRDISIRGIYFHSDESVAPGTTLELTFSLPVERDHGMKVLVRASGTALRSEAVPGENSNLFGIAAALDHIDFVRPGQAAAA